jgi:hypothetical protein
MISLARVKEASETFNRKVCAGSFFKEGACCPLSLIYCLDNNVLPGDVKNSDDVIEYFKSKGFDYNAFWTGFDGRDPLKTVYNKETYAAGAALRKEFDGIEDYSIGH